MRKKKVCRRLLYLCRKDAVEGIAVASQRHPRVGLAIFYLDVFVDVNNVFAIGRDLGRKVWGWLRGWKRGTGSGTGTRAISMHLFKRVPATCVAAGQTNNGDTDLHKNFLLAHLLHNFTNVRPRLLQELQLLSQGPDCGRTCHNVRILYMHSICVCYFKG